MATFIKSSIIRAPVERLFAFHERDDALKLLTPPFPPTRLISKTGGIKTGARVVMRVGFTKWIALHTDYERNKLFVDEQVSGPFRRWVHHHEFKAVDANSSRLTTESNSSSPAGVS